MKDLVVNSMLFVFSIGCIILALIFSFNAIPF
jgi:hypothetical protein